MTDASSEAGPVPLHWRAHGVAALIIFAATILVFSGIFKSTFTGWDDEVYVYKNPRVRSLNADAVTWFFTHSFFASYTPLALVSHAVDFRIWKNDPRGHHFTSILLHAANAVWLFILAVQVFPLILRRSAGSAPALFGAGIASLLFALHPLRVESIASVADRKDLLCAFFLVPSLISYFLYARNRGSKSGRRWYFATFCLFLLALLSKSVPIMFPFLLLLLDFAFGAPGGGKETAGRLVKEKIPFFILSLLAGLAAFVTAPLTLESDPLSSLTAIEKRLLPWYNLAFYPLKTLWPQNLSLLYEYDRGAFLALSMAGIVTTGVLATLLFRRWRLLPAGWFWYAFLLLPTSGIILSGIQPTADRYSYLPTMVFFVGLGVAFVRAWTGTWFPARPAMVRVIVCTLAACFLGLSALLTMRQIRYWDNAESLWEHAQRVAPSSPAPWYNLGLVLQDRGDFEKSIDYYARALRIKPGYPEIFVNLGNIHRAKGDTTRAIASYTRALELQPAYVLAHNNLAGLLLAGGRIEEAITSYEKGLTIDSTSAEGLYGLALAYRARGESTKAIEVLRRLVTVHPSHAQGLFVLGVALMECGDKDGALEELRRAARLNHAEAQMVLTERNIDW